MIKEKFKAGLQLGIFVSVLSFLGCATTGTEIIYKSQRIKPDWITRPPQDSQYLYFVGSKTNAKSLEEGKRSAIESAVGEIVDHIGIDVKTKYEEKKNEVSSQVLDEIISSGEAKIQSTYLSELYYEQWRPENEAFDRYNIYVLIRYSRAEIAKEKERQHKEKAAIEKAKKEEVKLAQKLYDDGQISLSNGYLIPALNQYLTALKHLTEIKGFVQVDSSLNNKLLESRIRDRIRNIINCLRLSISGGEKEVAVGSGPMESLILKISYENGDIIIPMKNVPVIFTFVQGQGNLQETAKTDEDGVATCKVYRFDPPPGLNVIESQIDVTRLISGSEEWEKLGMVRFLEEIVEIKASCVFRSYSLRKKLAIVVKIMEENLGKLRRSSIVAGEISGLLVKAGYQVIPSEKVTDAQVESILSGDDLTAKTTGTELDAQLMIVGSASTEYSGYASAAGVDLGPSCRATVEVRTIDVNSGKIIADWTETRIKGFGRTKQEAGENALQKTGKSVAEYIIQQLGL